MHDLQNLQYLPISTAPDTVGVGVDFGMTYSGAGIARPTREGDLPSIDIVSGSFGWGKRKIASKVYGNAHNTTMVAGNRALTKYLLDNTGTGRLYELFKRELVSDEDNSHKTRSDATPYMLTKEVIAEVLRDVDAWLVKYGWANVKRKYAFSYPSSWSPSQQSQLRKAAEEIIGTQVQLIDEPLSSAIAVAHLFAEHRRALQFSRNHIFVCDIGGGTVDFAAVEVNPTGLVRVVGPPFGAARLGMSNMDKVIGLLLYESATQESPKVDMVLSNHVVSGAELNAAWRSLGLSDHEHYRLLDIGEMFKIHTCTHWTQVNQFPAKTLKGRQLQIPRSLLEPFYKAMVDEIRDNIQMYFQQLADDRFAVTADYFDFVIISGGGSALPGVHAALREMFPRAKIPEIPINDAATLVQRGAAWYALQPQIVQQRRHSASFGIAILTSQQETPGASTEVITFDDGQSFEVGYRRLIRRGDLLSSDSTEHEFKVGRDHQSSVNIVVYEGDNDILSSNRLIKNVPVPLPRGARRDDAYKIVIRLHDDGMLHVRVKESANDGWLPGEIQLDWS